MLGTSIEQVMEKGSGRLEGEVGCCFRVFFGGVCSGRIETYPSWIVAVENWLACTKPKPNLMFFTQRDGVVSGCYERV